MNPNHSKKLQASLRNFIQTPLKRKLQQFQQQDPQQAVVELFKSASDSVPAYRAFLAEHGIEPETVENFNQFVALPFTSKKNYIQRYPIDKLCYQGTLASCDFVAVSSGSTGEPTFWSRSLEDEYEIATRFEQVFFDSFRADLQSTLAIVCFSLGTWVGGMYTASCCRHLATKGYPLAVVTPGSNQKEIFRVLESLAPSFEQVILLGYPPFLKDVIDSGAQRGIDWKNYQVKLVMAGEVFSEEWRDIIAEKIGSKNPEYDFASLYGTADAGVLGNETPLSIHIRRFFAANPDLAQDFFGQSRLPTLVQYDPLSRFFEVDGELLLFSGKNSIPLLRYQLGDNGGIVSYEKMLEYLSQYDFDPLVELQKKRKRGIRELPFVYVFGRADFTLSYYGANIYPENIQIGLEQPGIRNRVTGKFVMEIKPDVQTNSCLNLAVELAPGVVISKDLKDAIAFSIYTQIIRLNSEYANYVPPERQFPQVKLYESGNPEYFPPGIKHHYTR